MSQINGAWLLRTQGEHSPAGVNLWPELCRENRMKYFGCRNHDMSHTCIVKDGTNVEGNVTISLDDSEYPELGEITVRNKNSVNPYRRICISDAINIESAAPRIGRRCRRTDKICINLQEILESAIYLRKLHGKDLPKLRFNISKGSLNAITQNIGDTSKNPDINKIKICISKSKKPTKLKRLILLSRDAKAEINIQKREAFEIEKMDAISKEVNSLNFNSLKISTDHELDYVKTMSRLTFYDKDYRSEGEESVGSSEYHIGNIGSDISDRLINLHIRGQCKAIKYENNENFTTFAEGTIESDIVPSTLSLTIDNDKSNIFSEDKDFLKYSRNFREYCTNMLTPGLNEILEKFVCEITRLQKKQYEKNPNKAKYKRRYYSGLKEVRKHAESRKVKFVVVAPDLEKVEVKDGLDDQLYKLFEACRKQNVVFCFGLRRRKLGYYTHGKGLVGCIGVVNYTGTEEILKDVLIELVHARNSLKKFRGETDAGIDISKLVSEDYLPSERVGTLLKILSPGGVQN